MKKTTGIPIHFEEGHDLEHNSCSLPEGEFAFVVPSNLSVESLQDVVDFAECYLRRIRRMRDEKLADPPTRAKGE